MTRLISMVISGFGVFNDKLPVGLVEFADQGRVIVLGENADTLAADSNGAGKSTIFKALSWVLYGKTIDGLAAPDVLNKDSKRAEVTVIFRKGDHSYSVMRRRTAKTGKLTFKEITDGGRSEIDLTQTKSAATQEAIIEKLGLDWDAFRCTVLFGQGDHSRFASPTMGDAARKSVLTTVLRLAQYDEARNVAREVVTEQQDFIGREEAARSRIHAKVVEVDRLMAVQQGIIETNEAILETGEASKVELEDTANEIIDSLRGYAVELARLDAELATLDADKVEVDGLLERARDGARKATDAAREAARRDVDLATEGLCSECGQERPYDAAAHEKARAAFARATGKANRASKVRDDIIAELRELATERKPLDTERRTIDGRRTMAERNRATTEARIEVLDEQLGAAGASIEAATDRVGELVRQRAVHNEDIAKCNERIKTFVKRRQIAKWWITGFGPKGVPAYAIEQSLPILNEKANRHLLALADGDIEVCWTATTPGTSGVEKEELTQNVVVEGIAGAAPSGGQSKKIELATELALAEIMMDSEGTGMNILLLDEALDGLDAEGQSRVVDWIETMPHESVFVVSHDDDIAESFDYRLVVRKEGSASTIRRE